MRIILIAALFFLPDYLRVAAAAAHHPVTEGNLHNAMPAAAAHPPVTGKKLHSAVKPAKPKS